MNGHVWYHHWYPTAHDDRTVGQHQNSHQIQLWLPILLGHASICKKYTYNHVHDAISLQFILKELAGADGVRVLKDAPAPDMRTAHSVTKSVSYLQAMMGKDTSSTYTKLAYGVSSNIYSSEDECKPRARKRKKSQCSKSQGGRRKQKKEKDD